MIVSVAIAIRSYKLFDYTVADSESLLGRRVQVPLGNKIAVGIVMREGQTSSLPPEKLKAVITIYTDMPPLPTATLNLIRFCINYYHAPPGIAAAAAIPSLFRRASDTQLASGYRIADNPPADNIYDNNKKLTRAKKVWQFLQQNGCQPANAIKEATNADSAVLTKMCSEGYLMRDYYWQPPTAEQDKPLTLTKDQQTAVAGISFNGYSPYLLFGNTGSGKTEVYMRLAEKVLARGGQALILTPEIHLTPQLEESFSRRFADKRLAILHSGLTDSDRARYWLMARLGIADIVLGTRLAVFTPMPKLKLIVVDEEHDESYKQEEGLMFSARDIAVWRAHHEKITLVCGSATPSMESYENARLKRFTVVRMRSRPASGDLRINLIKESGALFHGMTQSLMNEVGATLKEGKQVLLFINRRGYSPMLACLQCGYKAICESCDARMTWHKRRGQLICHRCGATKQPPLNCPQCQSDLAPAGIGTQRLEEALNNRFAPIQATRLDSDSLTARGSFAAMQRQINEGKAQLLVGTQIIAKGHNFPNLSLIGVLNADSGLWSSDFRAEERLLALLQQIIGRGTRNRDNCRALIQTAYPEHPFYHDLLTNNVDQCWQRLSQERRAAQLPPFTYCALLRATSESEAALNIFFNHALKVARDINPIGVSLFDPVPSPIAKVAQRHRWQLLAQSNVRSALHQFLSQWKNALSAKENIRWSLEVDPANI